jgi:ribonucleoside-diphosphate reductase alpha chain
LSTIDDLLKARYYQPGESTWEDVCKRVSSFLMNAPWLKASLYHYMVDKAFIPSTPVLANAGTRLPMMCSCFVIGLEDSIAGIMKSLTETMMIQKFGGGVGIDFSPIRADGSRVASTNGIASGPVSFMGFWNEGMNVIKQGGKRQGALMGTLNVHHPDLIRFLRAKTVEGKLTNFNLSVTLDSLFFDNLTNGNGMTYACGLNAEGILDEIAANTWKNGEPGLLFLDNINAHNPYGIPITCTNPCGEVPLPPHGACCLGSINLNHALDETETGWKLNHDKLRELIFLGVVALNQVLDKTWWPLKEIEDFEMQYRPIGLGVMGLADMLVKVGVPYTESAEYVGRLFKYIYDVARHHADHIAGDNGIRRNATVLSVAPTGSIAMLADASYSIEPYFSLVYTKKVNAGEFAFRVDTLNQVLAKRDLPRPLRDEMEILKTGSVQSTSLPNDFKELFRTASEIPWEKHMAVMTAVQQNVDNAVSKTINLPASTSIAEVKSIIIQAHANGLKGLTMYRARSREKEVMECATGTCSI